jgi:16S rRNA (adenine1518-N6/adenine1519-N6)-dimethyltransferase
VPAQNHPNGIGQSRGVAPTTMQTKRQIQELLFSAGVSPNRRLGQHFLVDLNLMTLLVDAARIEAEDTVLEVGCGTGSLTQTLAQRARRVVAVELDRTLAGIAQSQLADAKNVRIIQGDVLSSKGVLNPAVAEALTDVGGRLLLVSNLPYDIASAVMIDLVQGPIIADSMTVTVQKEVAERMTAAPDSKAYGTLSIFLGATSRIEIVRVLKPSVFWPPPGVDSAIVRMVRDPQRAGRIASMSSLSDVVGLFMGHRRKMLRACIKHAPPGLGDPSHWATVLESCAVDPARRPENLDPSQYVDLANRHHELTERTVSP